ncbi:MAG: site-2 protease family protein [Clostridia bacterium]|jgi:Zn-dependent protease|nr:site-2 protease family protein [Clostridia bacterium]
MLQILFGEGDMVSKLTDLALYIIVILVSLSVHEWAHAFTAHLNGDDTARNMGRMTVNPLKHLEPIGMLMLLVFGFGWAKPVPVNPSRYRKYRLGEFTVSFAGIFANLVIAFTAAVAFAVTALISLKNGVEAPKNLYSLFMYFGVINCALAIFNLLPIYPLDGSHIFELLFGKLIGAKAVMWIHSHGRLLLYALFAVSFVLSRMGISLISDSAGWLFLRFYYLASLIVGSFA